MATKNNKENDEREAKDVSLQSILTYDALVSAIETFAHEANTGLKIIRLFVIHSRTNFE